MMGTVPLLSRQLGELDDSTLAIHQYECGAHRQSWGYSIRQRRDGSFKLDVSGRGKANWLPRLCSELFVQDVNILSGHIYRVSDGSVRGSLDLEAGARSGSPLAIDVMDCLADSGTDGATDSISLSRYEVTRSARHGGSVLLEIEGLDRRGFLCSLFEYLAPLELFVEEARVTTVTRMVSDRFWLSAQDDELEGTCRRLSRALEPLVDCYWAS
jgi:hypothetical protein